MANQQKAEMEIACQQILLQDASVYSIQWLVIPAPHAAGVTVEPEEVLFSNVRDTVERSFRHVADTRNLAFNIELDPFLPRSLTTDFKRLLQVLKNLLSNAFKFTRGRAQTPRRTHPSRHRTCECLSARDGDGTVVRLTDTARLRSRGGCGTTRQ